MTAERRLRAPESDPALRVSEGADPTDGDRVVYLMERGLRVCDNAALAHAVSRANGLEKRLEVVIALEPSTVGPTVRHAAFVLGGLAELDAKLTSRGIRLNAFVGPWEEVAPPRLEGAALIVMDRDDLRRGRAWRRSVLDATDLRVEEIETRVLAPIEAVSERHEYAARTFRPRIWSALEGCALDLPDPGQAEVSSQNARREGVDVSDRGALLRALALDDAAGPVDEYFPPGEDAALERLETFVDEKLPGYAERRSQAEDDPGSWLSPYLNWGQLSPARFVRSVQDARADKEDCEALLEELVVRRELAYNHVAHAPKNYDAFRTLPSWAVDTWDEHASDPRGTSYTRSELEAAKTCDDAWNRAMERMKTTGYLHNHLRMYWGKRVPKWTKTPRHAHTVLRELNDRWLLDGNHPPTYANIAWVFGLHDRPFAEGEVRGKTRPMTRTGLERKIDLETWPSV